MYPQTYTPRLVDNENELYLKINDTLDRLLFTLNTRPEQFKDQLEREIEDPVSRISVLKHIQKISDTNISINIKTSEEKPETGIKFPKAKDEFLNKLINRYKENGSQTIQGIIVKLS